MNKFHANSSQPLLFESMVFSRGSLDEEMMERYSTWEEAEAGHARLVQLVLDRFGEPKTAWERILEDDG